MKSTPCFQSPAWLLSGHRYQTHHQFLTPKISTATSFSTRLTTRAQLSPTTSSTKPQTTARNEDGTTSSLEVYDVVVIGGGPAGLSLASALGTRGAQVLLADAKLDKPWPNNYGVWLDDLTPLGLEDCVSHVWQNTSVYVNPDAKSKTQCHRPYARVDRRKLKAKFLDQCISSRNVSVVRAMGDTVDNASNDKLSYVNLKYGVSDDTTDAADADKTDGGNNDDENVRIEKVAAKVVVDSTGHKLRFIKFEKGTQREKEPSFQAAYGIECTVTYTKNNGIPPWNEDEMQLMDFRDEHMQQNDEDRNESNSTPTFIYVMPFEPSGKRIFFEETSLVASPAMDFEVLKKRLYKRLDYYGVTVNEIYDEELCLIPMGGSLPTLKQRVVAFGGSAAFVHPATGYMIARALTLANQVASIIVDELQLQQDKKNMDDNDDADERAYRIWKRVWNIGRQRQRDFFNFGGDYLAAIDLQKTRQFFNAFFNLPIEQWAPFLSFQLMQPTERLKFGLAMFFRTSNEVRYTLVLDAVRRGKWPLIRSVLPLYEVE